MRDTILGYKVGQKMINHTQMNVESLAREFSVSPASMSQEVEWLLEHKYLKPLGERYYPSDSRYSLMWLERTAKRKALDR